MAPLVLPLTIGTVDFQPSGPQGGVLVFVSSTITLGPNERPLKFCQEPAKKPAAKPVAPTAINGSKKGKQDSSSSSSKDDSDDDEKPAAPVKKASAKESDSSESDSDDDQMSALWAVILRTSYSECSVSWRRWLLTACLTPHRNLAGEIAQEFQKRQDTSL